MLNFTAFLANISLLLINSSTEFKNINTNIETPFYRACDTNYGFGSNDYTLQNNIMFNNLAINQNISIFKQINNNVDLNLINKINHLTPTWKNNLNYINKSMWQYAGSNKVFGVYPAFDFGCDNYFPPGRPWYYSATIGKGNYFFLFDISSNKNITEFNNLKNLVKKFISLLSFYDYFIVLAFDVLSKPSSEFLLQATADNKNMVINWIDTLNNINSLEATNLGQIINDALVINNESKNRNLNANCHDYIIIFSQGYTTINTPHSYEVIKYTNATISTYMTSNNSLIFDGLSCRNGGFTTTTLDFYIFIEYFSKLINITVPRFSEVYVDAFGLGTMTTAGLPIYNSSGEVIVVNAIDVVVNDTNINLQLQEIQSCEFINISKSDVHSCHQRIANSNEDEPSDIKYVGVIFAFIIVVSYLLLFSVMYHNYKKKYNNLLYFWGFGILILMLFWILYVVIIYPDQIKNQYWKPTKEYVISKNVRSYECANIVNCGCSDYYGISCNEASRNLLSEGSLQWSQSCQTGYYCCQYRTYCERYAVRNVCSTSCSRNRCNTRCHPQTYCANYVTVCIQSVVNRRCEVIRGICNNIYIYVEYKVNDAINNAIRSKNCGLNETSCVNDYLNSFPDVGKYKIIYYNPWDPSDTTDNLDYNITALVFVIIFAAYIIILIIINIIVEIRFFVLKRKKKNKPPAYNNRMRREYYCETSI